MAFKKRMWFCPSCRKGQIKSFFERKVCDFCLEPCEPLDVPYSGWTLSAWGVLLICVFVFLLYRDMASMWKWGILIGAVILAGGLASIGVTQMKKTAEEMGSGIPVPEESGERQNRRRARTR